MPLNESQTNKTLKYLIIGLSLVALIILFKEFFLKTNEISTPFISFPAKQIMINLNLLKSPEMEQISPFEKVEYSGKNGREDPFAPLKSAPAAKKNK